MCLTDQSAFYKIAFALLGYGSRISRGRLFGLGFLTPSCEFLLAIYLIRST